MSSSTTIAVLSFYEVSEAPMGGFRRGITSGGKHKVPSKSKPSSEIQLFAYQVMQVGRASENDMIISHESVSRKHFMLYSVTYSDDGSDDGDALVYLRDCGSKTGTFIKSRSNDPQRVSRRGFLLSHGDIIKIQPSWEVYVHLTMRVATTPSLSHLRLSEHNAFNKNSHISRLRLGKGTFGTVHLATDMRSKKQIACKIHSLDKDRWSSAHIRRMFDEIEVLNQIGHPNLLKFAGAFRLDKTLYTFTELAMGGDLFSLHQRCRDGIPEQSAQIILRQIVSAVAFLHRHNIAHRDLKLENIYFAEGPVSKSTITRVIVGDLGVAKEYTVSRMKSKVGTPGYQAPEIFSHECYDLKVDVWAIGKIALVLMCPAFYDTELPEALIEDQTGLAIPQEMMKEMLDDIFNLNFESYGINLSKQFTRFVRQCLTVDPAQRTSVDDCVSHIWFKKNKNLDKYIWALKRGWKPPKPTLGRIENLYDHSISFSHSQTLIDEDDPTPTDHEVPHSEQVSDSEEIVDHEQASDHEEDFESEVVSSDSEDSSSFVSDEG
ncbi:kinase-like protein [Xylariaceae sp. FL0255]|nr:kinase-like protein [Xylariaceae sp. FL0255]